MNWGMAVLQMTMKITQAEETSENAENGITCPEGVPVSSTGDQVFEFLKGTTEMTDRMGISGMIEVNWMCHPAGRLTMRGKSARWLEAEGRTDYLVTVCAVCRRASCWHGEFTCEKSSDAGTVDVRASALRAENREHPDNFSAAKLLQECGAVRYVA